ncbi:hypothetical protein ISCGN_004990 [Ixodes scapularis]
MAADDGRGTSLSELLFAVPENLSSFEREIVYRSKQSGFIPYDTPDHVADSHKDAAESSPLRPAEDIARLTNTIDPSLNSHDASLRPHVTPHGPGNCGGILILGRCGSTRRRRSALTFPYILGVL